MKIRDFAPEVKIAAAVAFVLVVALTPPRWALALLIDLAIVGAFIVACRVPARQIARRAIPIVPFLLLAAGLPLIGTGDRTTLGGLDLSVDGLWAGYAIATKACTGVGISILLTSTTTTPSLLLGLQRLKVPKPMISIASLMLRYFTLIGDDLAQSRTAMTARGHDPRWLGQVRPIASSAGAAFVRSYERGERVHAAMLARGFNGAMPDLGVPPAKGKEWTLVGVAVLAAFMALAVHGATTGVWS